MPAASDGSTGRQSNDLMASLGLGVRRRRPSREIVVRGSGPARYSWLVDGFAASSLGARVSRILPDVDAMVADVAESHAIHRPSAYWDYINERNLEQLNRDGFDRFKRSINQNYFSFVACGPGDDQYDAVLRAWKRHPTPTAVAPRRIDVDGLTTMFHTDNPLAGRQRRRGHARYIAMLWESVRRRDYLGLLTHLEEPALGAPITISYRGRRVSQDLCNSVHEFYSATEAGTPRTAIEIGGGYGRVGWVFLSALPELRYVMCDIPPALAIAQRYLTTLFPDRRAFTFRRFAEYAEIADEFTASKLAFITPGQLDLLPPQAVDLVINISSFHEMRSDQVHHYFGLIDRHCAGSFYTKQWIESVNVRDDLVFRRADYPIHASWRQVYSRVHEIQTKFFEALYQIH
jgi:putative sugar O-methyltransferase